MPGPNLNASNSTFQGATTTGRVMPGHSVPCRQDARNIPREGRCPGQGRSSIEINGAPAAKGYPRMELFGIGQPNWCRRKDLSRALPYYDADVIPATPTAGRLSCFSPAGFRDDAAAWIHNSKFPAPSSFIVANDYQTQRLEYEGTQQEAQRLPSGKNVQAVTRRAIRQGRIQQGKLVRSRSRSSSLPEVPRDAFVCRQIGQRSKGHSLKAWPPAAPSADPVRAVRRV